MRIITLLSMAFLLAACMNATGTTLGPARAEGDRQDTLIVSDGERDPLIGQRFLNVREADPKGRMHSLSDYAGRGKWVLVDFWASWCRPCQREMPYVVAAYKKYHRGGLEIVGFSFDENEDDWKEAIKEWNMPWVHLSDLKFWSSEAGKVYGVSQIPDNILINPDGIIVARDLRGTELEEFLSGIFD